MNHLVIQIIIPCWSCYLKYNLCHKIYVTHFFCWFLRSSILFPYLYFNNNWSTSFFILFSARNLLLFIINSISCYKFSSTFFSESKLKQKILGSLITIIFSAIIIKTLFQWFYYADTKDTVIFWFYFLICMNCLWIWFVLIILEV